MIKLEPSLSPRIVRLANSAHFGRGGSVDNVHEAIQRVGLLGVHELLTLRCRRRSSAGELYGSDAPSLWARAVACALAAGTLANNWSPALPRGANDAGSGR